jgi:hypothetical protein
MPTIVFGGVEIPSNRTLLERSGVTAVSLNFWGLRKRGLPKTKPYLISEHFDPQMKVWVDSGSVQADKASLTERELEEHAGMYEDFVAHNYDRVEGWTEFDSRQLGLPAVERARAAFEDDDKLMVVWHPHYGVPLLRRWAEQYRTIALPAEAVDTVTSLAGVTRSLQTEFGTQFHGLAIAKPDNLRQVPFTSVSTLAWLSPMRRGETIVWDGSRLVRYPKKMKSQARARYKGIVQTAGLDFDKFIADDTLEATRVAVWSYRQLELSMDKDERKKHLTSIPGGITNNGRKVVDNSEDEVHTGLMDWVGGASANKAVEERKAPERPAAPTRRSETIPMPGVGFETKQVISRSEDGTETLSQVPLVRSSSTSLRQCDTCFVAANCPAFQPGHECAFNLPVQVQTAEQLKALLLAMVEIQGQRVAFMKMAEDLNGGYSDPNLGGEIDRLFKLVGTMKKMEDNREFERITIERNTSGGVLSRIFGDQMQSQRDEPAKLSEEQTTLIMRQSLEE